MLGLILITVAFTTASRTVFAQEEPDPGLGRLHRTVRYPEQVDAVNALADQLGEAGADLETLYQLSRLLSAPCDQVFWLRSRIESRDRFGTDPATRASAETVLSRIASLAQSQQSALSGCGEQLEALQELLTRISEPPIPWEITDPSQLATRWRELDPANNVELQRELSADRKLILAARGVPAAELGLSGAEPWKLPRRIVSELAETAALPRMHRLLQMDKALRAVEARDDNWSEFDFPVGDTFQVTRVLLDRALGVDAQDRSAATARADFQALASNFESRDLWAWAALARCMQSAESGRAEPIDLARVQWQKASQVSAALGSSSWLAADGATGAWLNRLAEGGELDVVGQLPLSADYRVNARQARRELEDEFLRALDNPTEALRLIQLAKAAGIGRDPSQVKPITPDEIEAKFQIFKRRTREVVSLKVFALLEMIAVSRPGQATEYYGVLMNVAGWSWIGISYEVSAFGPYGSPAEMVRARFDARYKQLNDLRLLIAVDGPLDGAWFEFEREQLSPYAGGGGRGNAWLAYLPSLSALQPGEWPLDDVMRHFHQTAGSSGRPLGYYARARSRGLGAIVQPQAVADRLDKAPSLPLYAFSIGDFPPALDRQRPRGFVGQLARQKANASPALPVMLVFTGGGS